MLIEKIDPKKPDPAALKRAAAILKRGGLVVYPTETAYALGCDPRNARAVQRIFSIKGREAAKALPCIAASFSMARRHARLDALSRLIARDFWPGPLTLILPGVRRGPAAKHGEIALRVSPHPVAAALSRLLGAPIVSTSANYSGRPARYDVPAALCDLGSAPDVVLDAGRLQKLPQSTLVRARGGVVEILREGPISEEKLHRALMRRL